MPEASRAQQLLQRLTEGIFGHAADPRFTELHPRDKQDWIGYYLYRALRQLEMHQTFVTLTTPEFPEQQAAMRYLVDKRVFTSVPRLPSTPPRAVQFRVDVPRAIAYYRLIVHQDPDFRPDYATETVS